MTSLRTFDGGSISSAPNRSIRIIISGTGFYRREPEEVRAEYYRAMLYCRNLPESDEMLKILKILDILTLVMVQVPERVVAERKRLEQLFGTAAGTLTDAIHSTETYHKQLDTRLADLPSAILNGISPSSFARKINAALQQEFATSQLPKTSMALRTIAEEMKKTTSDFALAATSLGGAYSGALADSKRSTQEMTAAISEAAKVAEAEARNLCATLRQEYRWSLCLLTGIALFLGLLLGILLQRWIDRPAIEVPQAAAPLVQPASPPIPVIPKHASKR